MYDIYRSVVRYFTTDAGRCPFRDFLDGVTDKEEAAILGDLAMVDAHGLDKSPVSVKPIKGHFPMWELRVWGFRVLFVPHDGNYVVLGGCKKQNQEAEISASAKRMKQLRG
jgi:Gp49-like protein DUF891